MYKRLIYKKEIGLSKENFDVKDKASTQIEVFYSGINYKDALGVTGSAPIFKKDPIVPGIDFAGVISLGPNKGKKVIAQGEGFGESLDGGYTQVALVEDESKLVSLPKGLTLKESMILGTAGFTAALAVYRMLKNGQKPEQGPVLVSGATGGVGSFAIQILKKVGFEVHALTHRMQFEGVLLNLGADRVLSYKQSFSSDKKVRPLEKSLWAGVIDNLGGDFLSQVIPQVKLWGNIASIGLAMDAKIETTVMPFILRGVSLLGVSSANSPHHVREEVWNKLSKEWKPQHMESLVDSEVSLFEVLSESKKLLEHKSKKGRIIVDLKKG